MKMHYPWRNLGWYTLDKNHEILRGFVQNAKKKSMKMHYPWGNLGCILRKKPRDIAWIWVKMCKQNYENALSLGKSWVCSG
jgi:hypothetical protein